MQLNQGVVCEPFDKQLVLRLNILGLLDLQDPSAIYEYLLLALLLTFSTSGMDDACSAEPSETGIRSVKPRISLGQFRDAYLSHSHSVDLTLLVRPGNPRVLAMDSRFLEEVLPAVRPSMSSPRRTGLLE